MARPRSMRRSTFFLVIVAALVSVPIAQARPAAGLPIDDQLRDAIHRAGHVVDQTRDVVARAENRAGDEVDRMVGGASAAVAGVVAGAADAVSSLGGSGSSGGRSESEANGQGGKAGSEGAGRSARASTEDQGDVDELARGGNEIAPGSGQQGAGISVPLPSQGGENAGLGFTGLGVLLAVALALLLSLTGTSLLAVGVRRGVRERPVTPALS